MVRQAEKRTPAGAAIADVLGAEQDALSKIAACEEEAERIRQQSRKAVRELVRKTQNRISALHSNCAARTRELVAEMEEEASRRAPQSLPENIERDRLIAAVGRVAAELTSRDVDDVD